MNSDQIKHQFRQTGSEPQETDDERLAQLVDELAVRLCEGGSVDWPSCLAEHPHEAAALKDLAPAIEILAMFTKGGANPI